MRRFDSDPRLQFLQLVPRFSKRMRIETCPEGKKGGGYTLFWIVHLWIFAIQFWFHELYLLTIVDESAIHIGDSARGTPEHADPFA